MPDSKETIVFLDFCGTCVPFQSAPRYIDYTIARYPRRIAKFWRRLYKKLEKYNLLHCIARLTCGHILPKEMETKALKGYSLDILEESAQSFYRDVIKPNLIPKMIEIVKKHQADGMRVVLVSGGFGIYLKYFAEDFNIAEEDIISSNVQIKSSKATGQLEGLDCMEDNKVKLIEQRFNKSEIYSIAYSDSYSDIPLLQWVDKGVVVIQKPIWPKTFNFNMVCVY